MSSAARECTHCGDTRTSEQTGILAGFGLLALIVGVFAFVSCARAADAGREGALMTLPIILLGAACMVPLARRMLTHRS
jgi:hypothetical protein